MSVVIVGGNERMERRYKDLCEDFQCRAKVFTKPRGGLRDKVGSPDLMIFFTDTMSHKMLLGALVLALTVKNDTVILVHLGGVLQFVGCFRRRK